MSDFGFTFGKQAIGRAAFNLVSADIRIILCMTSTTATVNDGTGVDATFISGITLDEFDGGANHPPSFANRELLLGTEFDADTERDKQKIGDFTTLDEFDGGGSHPPSFANREQLLSTTMTVDEPNDRAEFKAAASHTVSSIPAGTRATQGIVVYFHVTNDAASVPLLWIDSGGFPFTANGGDLVLSWNAEGIGQITSAG